MINTEIKFLVKHEMTTERLLKKLEDIGDLIIETTVLFFRGMGQHMELRCQELHNHLQP